MASSLRSNLSSAFHFPRTKSKRNNGNCNYLTVRCGPRNNRGALVRGRVLSIEAIQAVQALKRAQRGDEIKIDELVSRTLSRLIKNDLISSLKELLRQNQCELALKVFSAVRSEAWYQTDWSLYADVVSALERNGMPEDIDRLISDLEGEEGLIFGDGKGLARLIKALIAGGRTESTVRIYELMKKAGWKCTSMGDEYVVKVLSRGLRRFGKEDLANEIDRELRKLSEDNFEKLSI